LIGAIQQSSGGAGMLKALLVGFLLMGVTVGIHAVGSAFWLRYLRRRRGLFAGRLEPWRALKLLSLTALYLLALQVVEVGLWAVTYLMIPKVGELRTFEEAVYFSTVTFTTLGYGDLTLSGHWRLLSGMEAMNGILLMGWSTAMLFAVVQRLLLESEARDEDERTSAK